MDIFFVVDAGVVVTGGGTTFFLEAEERGALIGMSSCLCFLVGVGEQNSGEKRTCFLFLVLGGVEDLLRLVGGGEEKAAAPEANKADDGVWGTPSTVGSVM